MAGTLECNLFGGAGVGLIRHVDNIPAPRLPMYVTMLI